MNTKLGIGQFAVTGAAQKITGLLPESSGVEIKALPANTGTVWLGKDSSVSTTTGYPLAAGQAVRLEEFAGDVWVIGPGTGEKVAFASLSP